MKVFAILFALAAVAVGSASAYAYPCDHYYCSHGGAATAGQSRGK